MVARSFHAHLTTFALMIHENVGNVNFFCEKTAKNVKTGFILANFSFFVKFFREKLRKVSNSREKLPKMVESDFNLANLGFFVNVSPFVGQDRLILPGLRSGDLKLQRGRGTGPRPTLCGCTLRSYRPWESSRCEGL